MVWTWWEEGQSCPGPGAVAQAIKDALRHHPGAAGTLGHKQQKKTCVLEQARGTGAGAAIMQGAIEALRERGAAKIKLSSQTYAIPFYEKLGFVAFGPEYPDAGIPHRDMVLEL